MNNLISYLSGIVLALFGLVGLYFCGKRRGAKDERQHVLEETLKVVNEVKKTTDAVDAMPNNAVRDSLREFTRD